jgi:hypothetical protein
MDHYSGELLAKLKIKERRKEAELNRLLNRAADDRQCCKILLAKLFYYLTRKPDNENASPMIGIDPKPG